MYLILPKDTKVKYKELYFTFIPDSPDPFDAGVDEENFVGAVAVAAIGLVA
ncbi:MAG: hypothetical protein JXR53_15305 [Bacteroidales bacterium]|nr:hypothetical protein [Bacteroidales bacterium]